MHDDIGEARAAAAATATVYAGMRNYQRILEVGGLSDAAEAAIVGGEASVRAQLQGLLEAGATDVWAAVFPVGKEKADRIASLRSTTDLLRCGHRGADAPAGARDKGDLSRERARHCSIISGGTAAPRRGG